MNYETTGHILWPFRLERDEPYTTCDSCMKSLDEWEVDDSCEIDGRIFCDKCASEYIAFRCGMFRDVSEITKELIFNLKPINPVFHNAIHTLNNPR